MDTKLLYKQGNLFTGTPWGVVVEKAFGSSEVHGPFSSETEAWNYGIALATRSTEWENFHLVKLVPNMVKSIATAEEIREHRKALVAPKQ